MVNRHTASAAPALLLLVLVTAEAVAMTVAPDPLQSDAGHLLLAQRARICKDVRTCEEAVRLWCGGYGRADGDKDGIPCENVCTSKAEVDRIRKRIGC